MLQNINMFQLKYKGRTILILLLKFFILFSNHINSKYISNGRNKNIKLLIDNLELKDNPNKNVPSLFSEFYADSFDYLHFIFQKGTQKKLITFLC